MKIAMAADLQFDLYPSLSSSGRSRLNDLCECYDWMAKEAVRQKCSELFLLGDIWNDRAHIDVSVLAATSAVIQDTARSLPTTIIPGNHDCYLKSSRITSVSSLHNEPHVKVYETVIRRGNFVFAPWMESLDEWTEAIKPHANKKSYLFAHATVAGSIPGGGGWPVERINPFGFKHVFLGDVHTPMEMADDILYLGGFCQHNFGDAGQARGFWILDTDKDSLDFIENEISPKFYIIDSNLKAMEKNIRKKDYVRVKGTLTPGAPVAIHDKCDWVETESTELSAVAPRLDLKSATDRREMLGMYYRHVEPEIEQERLNKLVNYSLEAIAGGA